jgi:hypothetical protein
VAKHQRIWQYIRTFKKEMSYLKTKKLGIQQDFNFGTGSGCSAGYCTD